MVPQRRSHLGVGIGLFLLVFGLTGPGRAGDDKEVQAILDKAIRALGGQEKLSKVKAVLSKSKGQISLGGADNEFTSDTTVQGLDHFRQDFEGNFGGNQLKGSTILAGEKGWRKLGDMQATLGPDEVANLKQSVYLQMTSMTVVPLKEKPFKVERASEEKVDGKPAVGLKITGPDGKEFTLYFDKASGLPVKQVARVAGFMGAGEVTQETTFGDYKEMGGIQRATRIRVLRDGQKFVDQEITDFRVLDRVEPKTFAEP